MKHDFSSLSLCLHQLQKCFLIPKLRSIHNISSLKMNLNRLEMHLDERSKREMQIAHFKLLVRHISCHEMDATQSRASIYTFKSYLYIANRHSSTSSGSTLSDQRNTRLRLDWSQIKFLLKCKNSRIHSIILKLAFFISKYSVWLKRNHEKHHENLNHIMIITLCFM